MSIEKMTDFEVYRLGIETLAGKLGTKGVHRFLSLCGPCTGDYTVDRHEWIDDISELDTIVEEIQQERERKSTYGKITAMRRTSYDYNKEMISQQIHKMTDKEIHALGLSILIEKLSIAGMPRFIRLCSQQTGIYAIDPQKLSGLDIEGIIQEVIQNKHLKNEV